MENNFLNENIEAVETTTETNQDITAEYPEGFDAKLYNLETKTLRDDKVREILEANKKTIEDLEKQKTELRKIIGKGKEPENIEDYEKSYTPDSRYQNFYETEESKELVKNFNELAKNTGINLEQHKKILDFINSTLEQNGVIDTRTEEQKTLQEQDFIANEKKKLGKDANHIIAKTVEFIDNFGGFNEEQRKALKQFANSGATGVSIIYTLSNALMGTSREEIPTDVNIGGLADDYTLKREYMNDNTTDERRAEIINLRIKAGRTANFL